MPRPSDLPRMTSLSGAEILIGTQSGVTEAVTVRDLADYAAAQGTAGVASVNGETGALTITRESLGAEVAGAASAAETAARNHAAGLLNEHAQLVNPHGLAKADLGLGNVDNTSDASKPVSTAVSAELATINNTLGTKLNDAPKDGKDYVRRDGVWQLAPAGQNGNKLLAVTEAQYAALTPEAGVFYGILPNPPATNLLFNADFASADSGWTQYAGTAATFTGGVCAVNSTANHTIGQANAAMVAQPPAGGTLNLSFRINTYVDGTFNPRVRYTDGTFGYFYNNGDPTVAVGIAGGAATVGTHTPPAFTLNAAKTFDRFEMRCAIRDSTADSVANAFFDASFDDLVLTVA